MRRVAAFGAAALVAIALLAGVPAAAGAAEKSIWGPLDLPGGGSAFPTYQDLGVDTFQMSINMATTAPTRPANPNDPADPAYRWPAEVDEAIRRGRAAGVEVALLASYSPGWANGGKSTLDAPDPAAWAAMMTAAAKRYPQVKRWMIWGEPNRSDRFLPNANQSPVGPRAYAPILDSSYEALKRVSRDNIVIGGMTWTGGTVKPAFFLKYMRMPSGKPPRLDWFGHNPFPFRFPNLVELAIRDGWRDISDLDTFGKELKRTYGSRTKFWLSEYTVQSDKGSREFELSVSRSQQARWLSASYLIADSLPQVAGLGWLSLLDEPEARGSANRGLMTAGGSPKPAFNAFKAAPSVRFRPGVRVGRRIRSRSLRRTGLAVKVRPRVSGRFRVRLLLGKKQVAATSRVGAAGRLRSLRLRSRTRRKGATTLVVQAPRGESVRRTVRIR